ncbi:hypothetical protein TKK_0015703 [Trichogramma kaykai]
MDSEVEDNDDDGSESSSGSDSDKSSEKSDDDSDEENETSSDSEPDQPLEVENINGIINDHLQEMDDLSEKNKWKIRNGVTYRLCTQIKDLRNKWQVKLGLKKPKKKNRKSKKNKAKKSEAKKTKTAISSSKNNKTSIVCKIAEKQLNVQFHVMPDLPHDFMLGMDTFNKLNIKVFLNDKELSQTKLHTGNEIYAVTEVRKFSEVQKREINNL